MVVSSDSMFDECIFRLFTCDACFHLLQQHLGGHGHDAVFIDSRSVTIVFERKNNKIRHYACPFTVTCHKIFGVKVSFVLFESPNYDNSTPSEHGTNFEKGESVSFNGCVWAEPSDNKSVNLTCAQFTLRN